MTLEKQTKTKRKYVFSEWNVAMTMTHIAPNDIKDIFPSAEQLKPEDLYPTYLLYSLKVK